MQGSIFENKGGFVEFKGGIIEFQGGNFEFRDGFVEFEDGFFEFQGGLDPRGSGRYPGALFFTLLSGLSSIKGQDLGLF